MSYCKIEAGVVVEHNISEIHIINRGHKLSDYHRVIDTPAPSVADYEYGTTVTPELIDGVPHLTHAIRTYPLDTYKRMRKARLKAMRDDLGANPPPADTTLGYKVDSSYEQLVNLQTGQTLGVTILRDADNVMQTVSAADWDTIILAVKQHGAAIIFNKWTIDDAIDAVEIDATNVTERDALIAVEAVGFGTYPALLLERDEFERSKSGSYSRI